MSTATQPIGQIANQSTLQQKMQAALLPFVKTIDRMSAGTGIGGPNGNVANLIEGPAWAMVRVGRRMFGRPIGGQLVGISSTGGTGYAANDLVTLTMPNGGRPAIIKVTNVSGGAPTGWTVIDPGSGLVGGGDGNNGRATVIPTVAVTQASTTGSGSGATWTAQIPVGLLAGQPFPGA